MRLPDAMNRRHLLRRAPQLAPLAAGAAVADADDTPHGYALLRVSRRAMATRFEVALPVGTPDAVEAAEDALDLVDDLEDQLTVFRDGGEVARLNEHAAYEPVAVEARLFELLQFCAGLTRETDGAFDVAAGALVKAWGFYRRQGRVPTPREQAAAMAATGMRHVVLDPANRTVRFRVKGLEFNFGAVGKGYALDRAAELLRTKWGIRSALLHGGGSSVVAIGAPPDDPRGWPISLRHPADDGRSLGTVRLRDAGLGTSAATFQYFVYNNRRYGHLLDPRVGRPADGTAAATAVAPTASEADALSTAAFVLGPSGADRLTRLRPHAGAVVLADGADAADAFNLDPTYDPSPGEPLFAPAHAD